MDEKESLSHSKWERKCHVVLIPKCRRRTLYKELRPHLGEVFRRLASQKESRIYRRAFDDGSCAYADFDSTEVRRAAGHIKGKSAIHMARVYGEKKRNFVGRCFWARGCFVWTVGRDETMIREYVRHQEQEDQRIEQLSLWN